MKKAGFKSYFVVYAISLAVSLATGTLLKLFSVDPFTGFVNTGSFPGDIYLLYAFRISLVAPIAFWFGVTLLRRARHDYPISYRHISSGILSIITGLCMIAYTLTTVPKQIVAQSPIQHNSLLPQGLGTRLFLLTVVTLGVVGGVSMIVGGANTKYHASGKPGSMLGFVPALWQLLVLLARFNTFIAITTITDVLLVILFMCFSAMFLIGQSRIIFGLGIRNGKTYAIPTGLSVSLIGFTFVVPNAISLMVNGSFVSGMQMNLIEFAYIAAMSVYSLVFLVGFVKSIKIV